jgi:hypothetical protein
MFRARNLSAEMCCAPGGAAGSGTAQTICDRIIRTLRSQLSSAGERGVGRTSRVAAVEDVRSRGSVTSRFNSLRFVARARPWGNLPPPRTKTISDSPQPSVTLHFLVRSLADLLPDDGNMASAESHGVRGRRGWSVLATCEHHTTSLSPARLSPENLATSGEPPRREEMR